MGLAKTRLRKNIRIRKGIALTLFVLTIIMTHGSTELGYKFLERENCHKVGKELSRAVKGSYKCKRITLGRG